MNTEQRSVRRMSPFRWLPLTFLAISMLGIASPLRAQSPDPKQDFLLIVPHTHWEGAVFKNREEYLQIGLPHIMKALSLLQRYPQYHYVLDQMAYVRPFLERYPNEVSTFKKMLDEHRLEIVGGTVVMEDENVPSGESIAHQFFAIQMVFSRSAWLRSADGMGTRHLRAQRPNAADPETGEYEFLLVFARRPQPANAGGSHLARN